LSEYGAQLNTQGPRDGGVRSFVGNAGNLALPREVKQDSEFNALRNCLGKKRLIVFQGVSEWLPKPERGETPIQLRRAKY
jgi:hypothetical protein